MAIVFACGAAHAPGILAWTDHAPKDQAERFFARYDDMRRQMEATRPDVIVAFTSEHWTNFFLDNYPQFCLGVGASHFGPTEPWLGIKEGDFPGDPDVAQAILRGTRDAGFDLSFSEHLKFDHGLMVPLYFMTPSMKIPVVPLLINTLVDPMPTAARCFDLGAAIGEILEASPKRVAVMATGGLSHWPAQSQHGRINETFDLKFLKELENGELDRIRNYTDVEIDEAGGGGEEVRNWVMLAGCVPRWRGKTLSYEAVTAWATGCGLATFEKAA